MCLIIAMSRVHPDAPLIIAANRDELFARPSGPTQVLQAESPRILGGRDEVAGGTWLAVNEHGVVAGLTNLRSPAGRDPTKRSRGELPILAAQHASAAAACAAFIERVQPGAYNPCGLLVGDARELFYLELAAGHARVQLHALGPGVHVLENRPFHADSPKADFIRGRIQPLLSLRADALVEGLVGVLSSRDVPPRAKDRPATDRPIETEAAFICAGPYGTRSSTLVFVRDGVLPLFYATDVPPGTAPLRDHATLWGR